MVSVFIVSKFLFTIITDTYIDDYSKSHRLYWADILINVHHNTHIIEAHFQSIE